MQEPSRQIRCRKITSTDLVMQEPLRKNRGRKITSNHLDWGLKRTSWGLCKQPHRVLYGVLHGEPHEIYTENLTGFMQKNSRGLNGEPHKVYTENHMVFIWKATKEFISRTSRSQHGEPHGIGMEKEPHGHCNEKHPTPLMSDVLGGEESPGVASP